MLHHGVFPCYRRANYEAQLRGKMKFYLIGTLITQETKEIGLKNTTPHVKLFSLTSFFFFFELLRQGSLLSLLIIYSSFDSL